MASMVFITPDDVRPGFELAGLIQQVCRADQIEAVIVEYIAENRDGILAIDERLLVDMSQKRLQQLETRWGGLFVIIPAPRQPEEEGEDYALAMVRRALGYHIRMTP